MRLCYLLEDTSLWGGQIVVFEQAHALCARGHDVRIVSKGGYPDWYDLRIPLIQVDAFTPSAIPACDFVIGTFWTTIKAAMQAETSRPVHLSQGYEGDFSAYAPYQAEIETSYRLPITTITVHEPLTRLLWQRFGKKAYTVGQGINHGVFFPTTERIGEPPWRVLLVGPYEVDWKGVHDGLLALKALKAEMPLWVVRVSQFPCAEDERRLGVVDEYHCFLRAREMAALYRSCDVLLAPSWTQEGFGLPVLEALACGTPVVLGDIPTYRAFAEGTDWAVFFAERDVMGMQRALQRVLANISLRAHMRAHGLEVAKQYTFARVAERIEQVLAGAL